MFSPALQKEKNKKMAVLLDLPLPYWVPKRRVPFDYVRFWWLGAIATIACIIGGAVCLGTEGVSDPERILPVQSTTHASCLFVLIVEPGSSHC